MIALPDKISAFAVSNLSIAKAAFRCDNCTASFVVL